MKITIDIGHNCYPDVGASGVRQEDAVNLEVGNRVISGLSALGYDVINCLPLSASSVTDSLYKRVLKSNNANVDLYVSIHFNAGGGRGTEVYAYSEAGYNRAGKVAASIASLGYTNRGAKYGRDLYVLRNTNAVAILVECCFVDSAEDMAMYNADKMADAIVTGITGGKKDDVPTSDSNVIWLQIALNRFKVTDGSGNALEVDGSLGPKTKSALNKFQSIEGLSQTNYLDDRTINAINTILNKPVTQYGSLNTIAVRYIQYRVSVGIDGSFGPLTRTAVMNFQRSVGIDADGSVGKITWGKLIG